MVRERDPSMYYRTIISILLFELAFFVATGVNTEISSDQRLLLFNIFFVLWLGMESSRVKLGHANAQTFGKFSRVFLVVSFCSILIAVWERSAGYPIFNQPLPSSSTIIGLTLFMIGVLLRHLSIKQLGKYFVTKVQVTSDHELITEGIYRFLRHPSYTGLIFGFLGLILFLQAGFAATVFILIGIPSYIYRIKVEEYALIKRFGQQYESYREKSYALLPLIY